MFLKFKAFAFLILIISVYGCKRQAANINEPETSLPPAVPSGLQVVAAHDGSVLIDWKPNAEANLKGYFVYRGDGDSVSLKKLLFATDSYLLDDSLSYDTNYYYKVSAVDDMDRESEQTYFVRARPVNLNPPMAVTQIEINARNWIDSLSVYLNWQPNGEGDISGYEVYRSEISNFTPGKDNFIGTAGSPFFLDTHSLKAYVNYYYKIIAVDKGGLKSTPGYEVQDIILGIPEVVFPENNGLVNAFDNFIIKGISVPAHYKIILQSNRYFGEIWSKDFTSDKINDTIHVKLDVQLNTNAVYFWRIATFTDDNSEPNSISQLNNFTIRP